MNNSIIFQYLKWHFFEMSEEFAKAWRNFLWFGKTYFPIAELLKNLFAPWHRYHEAYAKRFDPGQWIAAFTLNATSRSIGAIFRIFLIGVGIIVEVCIFFLGIIFFGIWGVLPLLAILLFFIGINLLI